MLSDGANETRFALDLPDVIKWLDGGDEPRTIKDSSFTPVRLLSLQTRNSAAYKGLMVLLMQEGSWDFKTGDPIKLETYFDESIDIHHIFPAAYCDRQKLPRSKWNSVINKTPLSATTNRIIGGHAPSKYLGKLEKDYDVSDKRLNEILESHRIKPEFIRHDDFPNFFNSRAEHLLELIEKRTGKQVSGRNADETVEAFGQALVCAA
ncbi:MAG: hypothetical protein WAX69_14680 [Victivallales bacterium]